MKKTTVAFYSFILLFMIIVFVSLRYGVDNETSAKNTMESFMELSTIEGASAISRTCARYRESIDESSTPVKRRFSYKINTVVVEEGRMLVEVFFEVYSNNNIPIEFTDTFFTSRLYVCDLKLSQGLSKYLDNKVEELSN